MQSVALNPKTLSPEAYLEAERNGTREEYGKFEYHDGTLVEAKGSDRSHNRISMNFTGLLGKALLDQPYEVFPTSASE